MRQRMIKDMVVAPSVNSWNTMTVMKQTALVTFLISTVFVHESASCVIYLIVLSGEHIFFGAVSDGVSILDSEVQISFGGISVVVPDKLKAVPVKATLVAAKIVVRELT